MFMLTWVRREFPLEVKFFNRYNVATAAQPLLRSVGIGHTMTSMIFIASGELVPPICADT